MRIPTRRARTSDDPIGRVRAIAPHQLDTRYIEVLRLLEPYTHFKYATIPWLHYLTGATVDYSVFRKYLGYMREAPNRYLRCPEQQVASPNAPYKTLVYQIAQRGLNVLVDRGLIEGRRGQALRSASQRNRAFALHRSNSFLHEMIVDLGYYAPLHHLVRSVPSLELVDFAQLVTHANVPIATRSTIDPLLIQLKSGETRFDGTPHLLIRTRTDGMVLTVGIPGIQVDRGTQTLAQLEKHLQHAIEFIDDRHYERHWGFDNCLIPFLFTKEMRKNRAMQFVRELRGTCPFLLFRTIPDFGLLAHFPKPEHYDRNRKVADDEWSPPDNIHVFTHPWQRVGYPDLYLSTFDEKGLR